MHSMLLTVFTLLNASNPPGIIETPMVRVEMPGQLLGPIEGKEATPWGEAMTQEHSLTEGGITYTFSAYSFKAGTVVSPRKLRLAKSYFLRHRKCVANVILSAPYADFAGKTWPQVLIGGHCISDQGYRTLFLVASGRVYRLTVTHYFSESLGASESALSSEAIPPPPPPQSSSGLDKAIRTLISHCHFKP